MSARTPGYRYRGLIWPAALILLGGVALLVNTNLISADRLYRLGDLWPLLLIVIGLELLVTRMPISANVSAVAAVLILLVALGGSIAYVAAGPKVPVGTQTIDRSASAGKLAQASLEVDVGAATINVRGAELNGDLFRAHIEYTGPPPDVSVDHSSGTVNISQNNSFHLFGSQRFVLNLQVSSSVQWAMTVHSGASADSYLLTSVKLTSLEVDTGASREEIALGTPSGSVPVTINGGALTVHLHRPSGVAAQVNVSGGAVNLDFDGRHHSAVGTVSDSSSSASDMFNVQIDGGACTVTMDQNSQTG